MVVRGVDGNVIERRNARATRCSGWTVDAANRRALCRASQRHYRLEEHEKRAGVVLPEEPPSYEWIELDSDRRHEASYGPTPRSDRVSVNALSPDGRLRAATDERGSIVLHDRVTGVMLDEIAACNSTRSVTALAFSDHALYAGTSTGLVLVFELVRGP